MKAMILAAGRGERMGGLTKSTAKPLLKVNGQHLIEYSLYALAKAGFAHTVININTHRFAKEIQQALGDGSRYGINIQYSVEEECLETGGGIKNALPLLGDEPFLLVSADIITDYPFENLKTLSVDTAHLILVKKPDYMAAGDFTLTGDQVSSQQNDLTYASMAVLSPTLFNNEPAGRFQLVKLLRPAIEKNTVSGELFNGKWINVGDKKLLQDAENLVAKL